MDDITMPKPFKLNLFVAANHQLRDEYHDEEGDNSRHWVLA